MGIAGRGMLMTSMDVDAANEAELNEWYDREHLAERVAIPGFVEARRYAATAASPRYLGLYSTDDLAVLSGEAYRHALANQTDWSKLNLSRAVGMGRAVGRVAASRGTGRGAHLGFLRLRPREADRDDLRARIDAALDPGRRPGLVSGHLVESDPTLSVPLTGSAGPDPGAADWYVLLDGSEPEAVTTRLGEWLASPDVAGLVISSGTYRLLWDLSKTDL